MHGAHDEVFRGREGVAEERRRIDVDPTDAETDAGRTQPVGKRQRRDMAVARDREAVELEAVVVALDDRLLSRRFR